MDLQQFGATIKQKYPQYKDRSDEEIGRRMLEKYPQYKDRVKTQKESILTTGSNVLRKLGLGIVPDAAAAVTNIPNLRNLTNPKAYKEGMEKNPFQDQEVVSQLAKGDTSKFRENQASNAQAFTTALSIPTSGGLVKGGARVIANPKGAVGRAIERKAASAGTVPNELLEKTFGSFSKPNTKLIEDIGTARDKGKLLQKLKAEIVTQGRGAGGVVGGPTFKDILNLRKGAGTAGKFGSNASGEDILLNRKLQQAYSTILKEGAGTEKLDKLFSKLSTLQTIGKKALPYGFWGSLGGAAYFSILNKINSKN